MITREEVVAEARTWLGTPHVHQARVKGVGVDCLGLIGEVAYALQLPGCDAWRTDEAFRAYGRSPRPDLLLQACERFLDRIPLSAVGIGDVLVMAFHTFPQHFAFVSREDPRYLIHSYPTAGKVVECGAELAGARPIRAYRLPGVAA